MGVPAFYRWISEKYPKIVVDMLEKRASVISGTVIPVNMAEPNPNGIEYDNLYIDMNGLIHPCSHPEDREAPKTEEEMYDNVTKYVDRLLAAVRPRRLLYLAIDGVAPRAKMNQQRSRRFRAAQEADEKKGMLKEVMGEMVSMGFDSLDESDGGSGGAWDSNVITPGTDFMVKLSAYLRYYILDRMNRDPYWRGLKVVLSDANEPGEGEHKIMNFIRSQRGQPGFDPNQRHILHGLDADLIMLALATHEAHFTILREKVTFGRQDRDKPEKSDAQRMLDAQAAVNGACISSVRPEDEWVFSKPLQALHVNTLREYLDFEFGSSLAAPGVLPFGYSVERVIDDFIFLCFFVGNDFLPHLPCLDIRDGALDFLLEVYKELLPGLGDYVTSPGGRLNLRQADVILGKVGEIEDQIFIKKRAAEEVQERRREQYAQGSRAGRGGGRGGQHHHHQPQVTEVVALGRQSAQGPSTHTGFLSTQSADTRRKSRFEPASVEVMSPAGAPGAVAAATISVESNMLAASKLKGLLGKRTAAAAAIASDATAMTADEPAVKTCKVGGADGGEEDAEFEGEDTVGQVDAGVAGEQERGSGSSKEGSDGSADAMDDDDASSVTSESSAAADVSPLIEEVLHHVPKAPVGGAVAAAAMSEADAARLKEELKRRLKEKEQSLFDRYRETIVDDVKLHESGWKDRYYGEKFKKENIEAGGGLGRMCFTYVQGLAWVLRYYYEGVPSWNWYYPFHYAPFASDLVNIDAYEGVDDFDRSQPFRPVEQLLAVLPANSVHALPAECHWLMLDHDTPSPIIDLYDADVPIDPNGKHLPWLWILLLPFVDELRIRDAFALCQPKLSLYERRKNALGGSVMYMHADVCPIVPEALKHVANAPGRETDADVVAALQSERQALVLGNAEGESVLSADDALSLTTVDASGGEQSFAFDAQLGGGMSGTLTRPHPLFFARLDAPVPMPAHAASKARVGLAEEVRVNRVVCFGYSLPAHGPHLSDLLPGVEHQPSVLNQFDLMPRRPPRLNKVGFNVVDLYRNLRGGGDRGSHHRGQHHQSGGSYQDYQLTGQFQERNFQQQHGRGAGHHHNQQQSHDGYRHQQFSASGGFGREMVGGGGEYGRQQYQQPQQYGHRDSSGYGGHQQFQPQQQPYQQPPPQYQQQYQQQPYQPAQNYQAPPRNSAFPQYAQQPPQQQQFGMGPPRQQQHFPSQQRTTGYGGGAQRDSGLLVQQQYQQPQPLPQQLPPARHSFLSKPAQPSRPQQPQPQQMHGQSHHLSQFFSGAPQPQHSQQQPQPPTMESMRSQLMQTLQRGQPPPQMPPYNGRR